MPKKAAVRKKRTSKKPTAKKLPKKDSSQPAAQQPSISNVETPSPVAQKTAVVPPAPRAVVTPVVLPPSKTKTRTSAPWRRRYIISFCLLLTVVTVLGALNIWLLQQYRAAAAARDAAQIERGVQADRVAELNAELQSIGSLERQAALKTRDVIKEVALVVELPTGELPTVATISDAEKLHTQAFFVDAQNDDILLVYAKASRAYLYRPSTKKLVNYGPITADAPIAVPEASNSADDMTLQNQDQNQDEATEAQP